MVNLHPQAIYDFDCSVRKQFLDPEYFDLG